MKDINRELVEAIQASTSTIPVLDSNGILRSNYLNGHQLLSYPKILAKTSQILLNKIKCTDATHVAGLALGGCSLAAGICVLSAQQGNSLFSVTVRQKEKTYGKAGMLSHNVPAASKVFLVDDVISTGQSALKAKEYLEREGLQVIGVGAVLRRGSIGVERIRSIGISVFTIANLEHP